MSAPYRNDAMVKWLSTYFPRRHEWVHTNVNSVLAEGVGVGEFTIAVSTVPLFVQYSGCWVVLDVGTIEAELRQVLVGQISGNVIAFADALDYTHSENDTILWLEGPELIPEYFGALSGGVVDDATPIRRAVMQLEIAGFGELRAGNLIYGYGSEIVVAGDHIHINFSGAMLVALAAAAGLTMGGVGAELDDFKIENLKLDQALSTANPFRAFINYGGIFRNIHIMNVHPTLATVGGFTVDGVDGAVWNNVLTENILVEDCDGDGIKWSDNLRGYTGINCRAVRTNTVSLGAGIYPRGPDGELLNCETIDSGDNGIRSKGARNKLWGCYSSGFWTDGIRLVGINNEAHGCISENAASNGGHCLKIENGDGCKVLAGRYSGSLNAGLRIYYNPLAPDPVNNTIIMGVELSDNAADGLSVDGQLDNLILRDIISHGNGDNGIELNGNSGTGLTDVEMSGCQLYDNGKAGLSVANLVTNLTINGGKYRSNTDNGMRFDAGSDAITNVTIGGPVCVDNGDAGLEFYNPCSRITINGGIYADNGTQGLYLNGSSGDITDVSISGPYIDGNGDHGLYGVGCKRISLSGGDYLNHGSLNKIGCYFDGSTYACEDISIASGIYSTNALDGLAFHTVTRVTISGGVYKNNGRLGISGSGTTLYVTISGANCYDDQGVKTQTYGIRTFSTCDYWTVTNSISYAADHVTGSMSFVGSNNLIKGNIGYVTENGGTASVADGNTIAHGLSATPTIFSVTPTVAGRIATAAAGGVNLTVGLKNHDGTAVVVAENVSWRAEV